MMDRDPAKTVLLSLIAVGIGLAVISTERKRRDRGAALAHQQQDVVLSIIEESGIASFADIKARYSEAVIRFPVAGIRKHEIHSGALKRALLALIRTDAVAMTDEGKFRLRDSSEEHVRLVSAATFVRRAAHADRVESKRRWLYAVTPETPSHGGPRSITSRISES